MTMTGGESRAPAVLIVTGASGVGKTTVVDALREQYLPGVGCQHFDSIGVPTPEEMTERFGSGAGWQLWAMRQWAIRFARNDEGVAVAVLDAQVRPTDAAAALAEAGIERVVVILLDCDHGTRHERLRGPRGQPELASVDMDCWAAYLRGQADALGLSVIDTSRLSVDDVVTELAEGVLTLSRA